ncbi:MAG TPA: hypothetical protein ENI89_10935 [Desulfobulbus sp.]|nr:hypothetical protein [Desulfobulbus sp.]
MAMVIVSFWFRVLFRPASGARFFFQCKISLASAGLHISENIRGCFRYILLYQYVVLSDWSGTPLAKPMMATCLQGMSVRLLSGRSNQAT